VAGAINYFYLKKAIPEANCKNTGSNLIIATDNYMPYPGLCTNRVGTKLAGPAGNHAPEPRPAKPHQHRPRTDWLFQ